MQLQAHIHGRTHPGSSRRARDMSDGKKFFLGDFEVDMVFSSDTRKNIAELLSRAAAMTYDALLTKANIEAIWKFWRQKPNNVLVPGHDLLMVLDDGLPRFFCEREASIPTWYAEDLKQATVISLMPNMHGAKAAAE